MAVSLSRHCLLLLSKGKVGLRFTVHVGQLRRLGRYFFTYDGGLAPCPGSLVECTQEAILSLHRLGLQKSCPWPLVGGFVVFLVRPNLQHARNYNSHVVYPGKTIEALEALNAASEPDDFVLTWWDYGSGSWFYGGSRTFTSPAHQTVDNFPHLRNTSFYFSVEGCQPMPIEG